MRVVKYWLLRWMGLIEPCGLIGDEKHHSHDRRLERGDGCLLCYGSRWVPTRSMIQAGVQAMSDDARRHIHPFDAWDAAVQTIEFALGDWEET